MRLLINFFKVVMILTLVAGGYILLSTIAPAPDDLEIDYSQYRLISRRLKECPEIRPYYDSLMIDGILTGWEYMRVIREYEKAKRERVKNEINT